MPRLRFLGDGHRLGATLLLLATIAITLAALIIGLQIKDAMADPIFTPPPPKIQDRVPPYCVITRKTMEDHLTARGYKKMGEADPGMAPVMAKIWNEVPPDTGLKATVVEFYAPPNVPAGAQIYLSWIDGDCWVDGFVLSGKGLMALMMKAQKSLTPT